MNQQPGGDGIDYLILGHLTRDITPQGYKLGGTAAYASLLAHRLGLRVGLITATGQDQSLSPLEGIQIHLQRGEHTTTFENRYTSSGRTQYLHHRAPPLEFQHIPLSWHSAPIVHLAPVAAEIDPKMMVKFQRPFLGITLQGWLREWDEEGRIYPKTRAIPFSPCTRSTVPVFSYEDIAYDRDLVDRYAEQCPLFIVTNGVRGADVYEEGKRKHIPALPKEERDPTGAGDIFAGAFFIRYARHGSVMDAAYFASSLAALSVTRTGLDGVPTRREIRTLEEVI